ncbi:hypothetical protein L9G16_05840 [Shewanella sp. A25]|nr:hypothetical protein [Shewanella shenzhenensis]
MLKRLAVLFSLSLTPECFAQRIPDDFLQIGQDCGVPPAVLYAIALTETGIAIQSSKTAAWAHSINWQGKGYRFKTRDETYRFAQKLISEGNTLFDIGVMQVNWRWHNERVSSLWDLTDSQTNIKIACDLVTEGYQTKRNWLWAAGYYHAPYNTANARKYMRKYRSRLNNILRTNPEARKDMRKFTNKFNQVSKKNSAP